MTIILPIPPERWEALASGVQRVVLLPRGAPGSLTIRSGDIFELREWLPLSLPPHDHVPAIAKSFGDRPAARIPPPFRHCRVTVTHVLQDTVLLRPDVIAVSVRPTEAADTLAQTVAQVREDQAIG